MSKESIIPRGTRIMFEEASKRRDVLDRLIENAESNGFAEIILPSLDFAKTYENKMGAEVLGQMYVFEDKKGRKLCLRPEGTATVQLLANTKFKNQTDVRLWYFERCYRYERPQAGRYREFFQFGVEILNPTQDYTEFLINLADKMLKNISLSLEYTIDKSVKRGLSYYIKDGFEFSCPKLGAQKQILGGGSYKEGVGFAIGFDRLLLALE